jgi:putative hydrolase of the HAD superfamily
MADKQELNYEKLLKRLDIQANEFFMIGNSLKSDVLPVLNIGGFAVHIPFHTTWEHEKINHTVEHVNFRALEKISDILPILLP